VRRPMHKSFDEMKKSRSSDRLRIDWR
jgi:hypothetical protein